MVYFSNDKNKPDPSLVTFLPFQMIKLSMSHPWLPFRVCMIHPKHQSIIFCLQVVANHHHDHLSLAVAAELEKAFGGWVCPSEVK